MRRRRFRAVWAFGGCVWLAACPVLAQPVPPEAEQQRVPMIVSKLPPQARRPTR